MLKIETTIQGTNSMPFFVFRRDHLRSTSEIICGSGSFAVQFGDHFRSGDHLRSGIICGAVQIFFTLCKHLYFFGTMSKRKISSSFQRQTAKIIDEAEEKTENWLHEAENDAWLSNSKPRNFQTKWLNEHNISKLNDSPDCYFDLKFYPSSPHALIFNTWRIFKELVM